MQIPGAKNESKTIELRERNRLKKIELKKKAAEMEKQLNEAHEGGFKRKDESTQGGFQSVSTVVDRKMAGTGKGKMKPMKPKAMKNRGSKMIDMV